MDSKLNAYIERPWVRNHVCFQELFLFVLIYLLCSWKSNYYCNSSILNLSVVVNRLFVRIKEVTVLFLFRFRVYKFRASIDKFWQPHWRLVLLFCVWYLSFYLHFSTTFSEFNNCVHFCNIFLFPSYMFSSPLHIIGNNFVVVQQYISV